MWEVYWLCDKVGVFDLKLHVVFVVYFMYVILCGLGVILGEELCVWVRLQSSYRPKRFSSCLHVYVESR